MPKLTKDDWVKLKADKVAFPTMPTNLFDSLLNKVYASTSSSGFLDDTDELMIYLARSEPPIQPIP